MPTTLEITGYGDAAHSALARMAHTSVSQRLGPLLVHGRVATCPVIDLEMLYSARSHTRLDAINARLDSIEAGWMPPGQPRLIASKPQQTAVPSLRSPQAWPKPVVTALKVPEGGLVSPNWLSPQHVMVSSARKPQAYR